MSTSGLPILLLSEKKNQSCIKQFDIINNIKNFLYQNTTQHSAIQTKIDNSKQKNKTI